MTTTTNNKINIITEQKEYKQSNKKQKKPITTFIRFSQDTRKYVRDSNPEYSKVEVTKELSRLWNNVITDNVKEQYRRDYIFDMEQYNRDKLLFDVVKTKKPMTTFIRFSQDFRKYVRNLHPEYNKVEVTKELSKIWKNELTDEVKEEYKERYIFDMEQYKQKKQKKPMTTFIRFSQDSRIIIRELHPEYNQVDVTKELARIWNNIMPNDMKEVYRRKYILDMEKYNRDKKL